MNPRIQAIMIAGVVLLSLPLTLLVDNTKPINSSPQAADTAFHASFSPGPQGLSCEIDDGRHSPSILPGEQITLKAGISGGTGAYTLKWKAEDKDFDETTLDAQGIGTFSDSGTPSTAINPAIWFAPSTFRDTTTVEIRLFVYDQDGSQASCSRLYAVGDTPAEATPSPAPASADEHSFQLNK